MTLQEALEIAYADDIAEIFIEPPDTGILTDEDSGDEDGGGLIDNLPASQLRAQAEVKLLNNDRLGFRTDVDAEFEQPDLKNIEWIQGELQTSNNEFSNGNYSKYKDASPLELFEMFFDDDIINLLLSETKAYALFKNCPDPKVSAKEMKCYLAILILTGYNELPGKRFYWDTESDMRNQLVYNSMRRNRFLEISRFLHFADNNKPDPLDKIWKMRPLMDKVKKNCMRFYEPEEHLCYDESMVKYFGRHGCKQFIRGKPIRFGYKIWCVNSPSGYIVNFEMYQGKNPRRSEEFEKLFGKAAAPLVTMLGEIKEARGFHPYKLYFDNLFTGISLLKYLRDQGFQGTGTLRENRIPKSCPLSSKKTMDKKDRGSYESIIDRNDGIIIVRWVDNKTVTVASTCFGVEPISNVRRYSQAAKKNIQVPRPHLIAKYNQNMGGTDRMDENIAQYRISVRGKKWWWCLFSWVVDICVQNAWQIHRKSGGSLPQLDFRRSIVQAILKKHGIPPKGPGRTLTSSSSVTLNRVSDDLRYDSKDHLVVPVPNKKRRRCAGEGCSSHIRTMCKKCDVGLCVECFNIFHTK